MLSSSSRACSAVSTVVLPRLDDVLRAAHRVGRIGGDDLAGDQPVEQHADGGEVLLDRRLLEILAERLDIGGDVQRLDVGELADLVLVAPGEEPHDGPVIGHARVLVADGGGEEFEEAARGLVAGVGDRRAAPRRRGGPRRLSAAGIGLAQGPWIGYLISW